MFPLRSNQQRTAFGWRWSRGRLGPDLQSAAQLGEVRPVEMDADPCSGGPFTVRVNSAWASKANGKVKAEYNCRGTCLSLNSFRKCLVTGSGAIGT